MNKQRNIQDKILNEARKDKISVLIYLTNGFQLKGIVTAFDNFTLLLESEGKQHMIYKSAISTIIPSRPIKVVYEEE